MKRGLLLAAAIPLSGCMASCPFEYADGKVIENEKYVGYHWVPFAGGLFGEPQLGCQQARALGKPEWHRLPSSIVVELIKAGELDKNRYTPEPGVIKSSSTEKVWLQLWPKK